jgi:hypothetical protein
MVYFFYKSHFIKDCVIIRVPQTMVLSFQTENLSETQDFSIIWVKSFAAPKTLRHET